MVRQGNDLAALMDISCDIIPFGYSLSREIWVPFWEFRQEPLFAKGAQRFGHSGGRSRLALPAVTSHSASHTFYVDDGGPAGSDGYET
jgi:hypothetical protein